MPPVFPNFSSSGWGDQDPSSLRAAIATLGAAAQWQRALGLFQSGGALDVYAGAWCGARRFGVFFGDEGSTDGGFNGDFSGDFNGQLGIEVDLKKHADSA